MTKEELKIKLIECFPSVSVEEGAEWVTMEVDAGSWLQVATGLRNTAGWDFDFLFCLTCIDWKSHFTMVYHLRSTGKGHELVVKSKLEPDLPEIESISHIWRTAEFHEREVYDLFGVKFSHHPDLRRLLLADDWKGHPLRKDYEDTVNMIKL